ncbi:hypothetical protein CEV33_2671 [Brucella grignonensis]|uniref:Uncharacterized protein n=1 Tax=Brucella grignonensis TaxID=94627 RepID=A0A256F264_9HYPH|nr:hypothetical protein CEV33_2671 [Brucella grignonensis]
MKRFADKMRVEMNARAHPEKCETVLGLRCALKRIPER